MQFSIDIVDTILPLKPSMHMLKVMSNLEFLVNAEMARQKVIGRGDSPSHVKAREIRDEEKKQK